MTDVPAPRPTREEPQHPEGDRPHPTPVRTYLVVFGVLLALLVVTVVAAFVNLGRFAVLVALGVAGLKALLVVLYFMHVRHSSTTTKVFISATFVWLGILAVLTFSDYLSRGWLPASRGWFENPAFGR